MENHVKFGFFAVWNGLIKEGKKAYIGISLLDASPSKFETEKVTLYPNIKYPYRAYYFFI